MEKIVTALRRDRQATLVRGNAKTRDVRDPKPARDVAPGKGWAFTDHRTLAEIIA
jgi:hypothetical protein